MGVTKRVCVMTLPLPLGSVTVLIWVWICGFGSGELVVEAGGAGEADALLELCDRCQSQAGDLEKRSGEEERDNIQKKGWY